MEPRIKTALQTFQALLDRLADRDAIPQRDLPAAQVALNEIRDEFERLDQAVAEYHRAWKEACDRAEDLAGQVYDLSGQITLLHIQRRNGH